MRTIVEKVWTQKRVSKKGAPYDIHLYLLDDGSEVESLQFFVPKEQVTVWYDDVYNKAKLKKAT